MTLDTCFELTGTAELSLGVLPHHLEQAETGGFTRGLRRHQRLVDETTEHVDDVGDRRDAGRGIEVEAAGEHGQTSERNPLVLEQEVVTPVEGGGEGLLAVRMAAPATGQDGQRIAQAGGELGDGEVDDPHRSQLEGEGDAVETTTDLGDRGGGGSIEHEGRRRLPRPLDEELDRFEPSETVRRVVITRKLERGHPPGDLARMAERLAGRGQDDEIGHRARSAVANGTTASRTCSQLSRMSRSARPASWSTSAGIHGRLPSRASSRAPPTADGTPSGCVTPASSTSHTPSAQREFAS